jgi:hypothetical protein
VRAWEADVAVATLETLRLVDHDLRKLLPRHFVGMAIDAGRALQVRIVEQHGLTVRRELYVEFHELRAELECGAQRRERILWEFRCVAAVGDRVRKLGR